MKTFYHKVRIIMLVSITLCTNGCSVYMAANQPGKKDLSLLKEGTTRGKIIAEFGPPVYTEEQFGGRLDIYKFVHGYHGAVKTGRALFHGTADFFTLGLWEVVATPTEALADGTEVRIEVFYDSANKLRSVREILGTRLLNNARRESTIITGREDP